MLELVAYGGQGQVLHAGGGQLDRQGKTVQPATDLDHEQGALGVELQIRPHRLGPLPEERRSRPAHDVFKGVLTDLPWRLEGRHRKLVLSTQTQGASTSHQECGLRATEQKRVHKRRCRRQVLEGVQDDQHAPSRQACGQEFFETGTGLDGADRFGKLWRDERCILQLAQRDKEDPIGE